MSVLLAEIGKSSYSNHLITEKSFEFLGTVSKLLDSVSISQGGHYPGNQRKVRENEKDLKSQGKVRQF